MVRAGVPAERSLERHDADAVPFPRHPTAWNENGANVQRQAAAASRLRTSSDIRRLRLLRAACERTIRRSR
jgi:hypothetical protein